MRRLIALAAIALAAACGGAEQADEPDTPAEKLAALDTKDSSPPYDLVAHFDRGLDTMVDECTDVNTPTQGADMLVVARQQREDAGYPASCRETLDEGVLRLVRPGDSCASLLTAWVVT